MCEVINEVYEKVVHWKTNLFQFLLGAEGKWLVENLPDWFFAFVANTLNKFTVFRAALLMPALLLRKTSKKKQKKIKRINGSQRCC